MYSKKITIIGANGYIGSALVKYLSKQYKVTSISSKKKHNVNSKKILKKIVTNKSYIIFLSNINSLIINERFPKKNFKVSILPLKAICNYANINNKNIRIIYFSSSSVYGLQKKLISEKSKLYPSNNYDKQKIICENILKKNKSSNLKYIILRLGNIYGPSIKKSQFHDRGILGKIINDAIKNKIINIYGSGKYYRTYLHISDLLKLINKILEKNIFKNEIYNIGSKKHIMINRVFIFIKKYISKKLNTTIQLKYINWPKNSFKIDRRTFKLSSKKIRKEFNWTDKVDLFNGIKNYINYYLKKNI